MKRWFFGITAVAVLAVAAGLLVGPVSHAGDRSKPQGKPAPNKAAQGKADHKKADRDKLNAIIKSKGTLKTGDYWALRGGKKRTIAAAPFTLKFANLKGDKTALTASGSRLIVGGEGLPKGFGVGFTWDRAEPEALLVMFVNAADPYGISIEGLKAGDQLQVMSASGIASYSEDKGNPDADSIIGLVAKGANIALDAAGLPEVTPLVTAAEEYARSKFKATNAKTKRRDPFGVDPGSGHKARQEGGLLVCLPEAGGIHYSGNNDHKERWIKGDGVRSDANRPAHVFGAFFPQQGLNSLNTRMIQQDGVAYVTAWDWKFEDNAGFYKVFVKLTRGNGLPQTPPTILKGAAPKTPIR
jgi:hypothetical protein